MRNCSGQGVFFLFKECGILLARKVDGSYVNGGFYNSVYLDRYGEEDIGKERVNGFGDVVKGLEEESHCFWKREDMMNYENCG